MTITKTHPDAFQQLVAQLRNIDKAADKAQVEGVAQLRQSQEVAVLASAKPELESIKDAEEMLEDLAKSIAKESEQAFGAVGQLNRTRVDHLLED